MIEFGDIRINVAGNPLIPVEALSKLSKDSDYVIRSSVARNPSTPIGLLFGLFEDNDNSVRGAVAENPSLGKSRETSPR